MSAARLSGFVHNLERKLHAIHFLIVEEIHRQLVVRRSFTALFDSSQQMRFRIEKEFSSLRCSSALPEHP